MSDIAFDGMVFDRLRELGDQSQRIAELEREIALLRLTDEERWAVSVAMGIINEGNYGWPDGTTPPQDTLRGLLERMGG